MLLRNKFRKESSVSIVVIDLLLNIDNLGNKTKNVLKNGWVNTDPGFNFARLALRSVLPKDTSENFNLGSNAAKSRNQMENGRILSVNLLNK